VSEKLSIDTPEQIDLEFTLAGVGSRFLAVGVDTLIQTAGALVLALLAAGTMYVERRLRGDSSPWPLAIAFLLFFLLSYGYFAWFEAAWNGQTPGKRLVGIRVIAENGRPLSASQSLLRNLLRIVDMVPGLYAVGIVSMLCTARQQRLGDLAAGSVVVHDRAVTAQNVFYDQKSTGSLRLTDAEMVLVEAFLRRRTDLDWGVRERTAAEITSRIRTRLGLAGGGSDEELLEQLVAATRATGWRS
jgi:uncharacterized RDD family membrane protein YckC